MMSLWDALRMNMMISYQELVRTFLSREPAEETFRFVCFCLRFNEIRVVVHCVWAPLDCKIPGS
ncbi:hypothetical protein C5X51_001080 [Klebsiella pneumoniae subsp. pneumoniae]|nr:hypothetical protein C5X51_001080 [Klebsiella pneumoniae subsp. pneumoniae]